MRLKPVIAEKAKEKQVEAGGALRQKSDKAEIDTKKELAKLAGVSHDTIAKAFFQIWKEPPHKKSTGYWIHKNVIGKLLVKND